jgi:hypothetical protein
MAKAKSKAKSKSKSKSKAKVARAAKKRQPVSMARSADLRERIPGIAVDLPDISNWRLAAKALRVKPFFTGAGAKPFSCLMATQINMDPPIRREVNGVMIPFRSVNDFFLAPECRD